MVAWRGSSFFAGSSPLDMALLKVMIARWEWDSSDFANTRRVQGLSNLYSVESLAL